MQSKWYLSGVSQFKKGKACLLPYRALQIPHAEKLWREGYSDAANNRVRD